VTNGDASPQRRAGTTAFIVDLVTILVVSVAIAVAADRLWFMTVFVPVVLLLRLYAWTRLAEAERGHGLRTEVAFVVIATVVGGFNDWNSVVRTGIYDYTVPVHFPNFSTVPIWMLLFWGMILRFFTSLYLWPAMDPPDGDDNRVLGIAPRTVSPWLRVTALLGFVLITRLGIFRWYEEPVRSWLPFAAAIVVYPLLFPLRPGDLKLAGLAVIAGPLIEIVYIQLGGLHRYHEGVIGGVPIWIMLWWVLIVLIWRDLSLRTLTILQRMIEGRSPAPANRRS